MGSVSACGRERDEGTEVEVIAGLPVTARLTFAEGVELVIAYEEERIRAAGGVVPP